MAQIRNFTSTSDSYFVLDGVSYPKVYEAMLDNGYTKDRIKLVGTNRDNSPLVFSTHYLNIKVDGVSFASAQEAISRLNEVVFSKGGGSGGGGTTGDYIPLSGTEDGMLVTGNLEFDFTEFSGTLGLFTVSGYDTLGISTIISGNSFTVNPKGFDMFNPIDEVSFAVEIDEQGLIGNEEFDKQGKRKAFAQLGDVYDINSYSTNETKTGGTWIDGKPIYTITKLTADPVPTDIETQFPNTIVGSHTVYKYTKITD